MDNNQTIARNTILLCFRMGIVLVLSLYVTRLILGILGVVDYGVYNVIAGFVSMFGFLNTSLSNGIQRFYNYELGATGILGAQKVFNNGILIQLSLAAILLLILESLGVWYINSIMQIPSERISAANYLFQFSLLSFSLAILQAPYVAAVMAHEKMNFFSLLSLIDAFLKLAIVFLVKYATWDKLVVYGFLFSLISVVNFFAYVLYCHTKFDEIKLNLKYDRPLFRKMLSFSGWNVFGSFSNIMKEQGLNMVLNFFFGPIVNAARGVSFQVMSGINGFVANVNTTTRPQIVQSYAKADYARTFQLFYSSSKLSFIVLFIFAFPLSLEIDTILTLWLGNNVPENSGTYVIWVLLAAAMGDLNGPVSAVVHATGRMKKYQLLTSISNLVVVPLSFISFKIGMTATSGFVLCFIFSVITQIVSVYVMNSLTGLGYRDYIRNVLYPLAEIVFITIICTIIPYIMLDQGLVRLVLTFIIGISATCSSYYVFGMTKSERQVLINLIQKK